MRAVRRPAVRTWDPLVLVPGGPRISWPPEDKRLTDGARRALVRAQREAEGLGLNYLGPVHLFIGLVYEEEGIAARVLADQGVTAKKVRVALASIVSRGEVPMSEIEITLTPRAQKIIEMASHEARRLVHRSVGTEHLLLAILKELDTVTSRLLKSLSLETDHLRTELLGQLKVPPSYGAAESASPSQGPYERFDDVSRAVLASAQEEALRMGHDAVGAEHLVLGLARVTEASGSGILIRRVFEELDVTAEQLRAEVARIQPARKSETILRDLRFTPMTKLVIELAHYEAGPSKTIHPEHILVAIGRAEDPFGGYILAQLGATPERVQAIVERRGGSAA
jgi:ATP-dependent Clp protease ATP-binding subunit ClpA